MELENLTSDIHALIAGRLTTRDLARIRAVNKAWKEIADRIEVRKASFKNTWGLAAVDGEPLKPSFFLAAGLGHFTIKFKQPPKSVSIPSLVVKYKSDNLTLRVLNNSTSDFSLECRTHVYIPVASREDLVGRNVTFTYDPLCRRQLVVLQEVDAQSACQPLVTPETSIDGVFDTLARSNTAHRSMAPATAGLDEAVLDGNQREALLKKLSRQMGRGLNIDVGTAAYYLNASKGDMKAAFLMYKEDLAWETEHPVGILPLQERGPIP